MSRPLRIEYPDAWYHVMNRGRRAEDIFSDEQDYVMFTELLKETSEMWNIRIAAFCLMPNHYHHRNPLQSGLADRLDVYKWSSHKGYISIAKKWDWLHKNYILSLLSKNRKDWLRYYRKWVSVEEKDKVSEKISGKKWPACLGPQTFIDRIKETYGAEKIHKDVPSSRALLPDNHRILEAVCKSYDMAASDILKMRRGKMNEARNVVIYLTRRLRRDTLKEIGAQFGIDNESTVSSVMERMKKKLAGDRKLSLRLDKIAGSITKS